MNDLISRQAVIEALRTCYDTEAITYTNGNEYIDYDQALDLINTLPPVQPKIIHCKDCKHWNLQVGNVKGDGLGSCDFHNVNLVTGEGFCYWAEKRGDSE